MLRMLILGADLFFVIEMKELYVLIVRGLCVRY